MNLEAMTYNLAIACRRTRGSFWLIIVVELLLSGGGVDASGQQYDAGGKGENNGCSSVKLAWGTNGFGSRQMVPHRPIAGEHLRICAQGFTCCTQQMETKLTLQGRQAIEHDVAEMINSLSDVFVTRTASFDAFVTTLIERSSNDLNDMFTRTYGRLYQQNSHIFSTLFRDLQAYYNGGSVDLNEALDSFFATLMLRMFALMNAQYTLDDRYLACVRGHMVNLVPFGDVPQKLNVQIKRAFVAARTFHQGLAVGRDVVAAVATVSPSESCIKAVTRMFYCPYCRGLVARDVRPCSDYCVNVMRGCLAYQYELNHAWNSYLEALLKVAGRLEGPFNIESVVGPINVKISDAIMNFQESSDTVTNRAFQACGQPTLGTWNQRKTREADGNLPLLNWNAHHNVQQSHADGIELLIQEIRKQLSAAEDFWKTLPDSICRSRAAPLSDLTNCWNGLARSRYTSPLVGHGVEAQVNNSEVVVDIRKADVEINRQILRLKLITSKLKNAYSGLAVDYTDFGNDDLEGSGSGSDDEDFSGSGSRHHDIYLPEDHRTPIDRHQPPFDRGLSFTVATAPPVEVVTWRPSKTHRDWATSRTPVPPAGSAIVQTKTSMAVLVTAFVTTAVLMRCFRF